MFERVEITVRAGDGGDGAVSFRREKFVPLGGPDGGDGGAGGSVVIRAGEGVTTLRSFQHKKVYPAGKGGNGQGKRKHGKDGRDTVLEVPLGTVVMETEGETGKRVVADLKGEGQEIVVARGGKGGWGNVHFASSTNQTPRIARKGEQGEAHSIMLELRLIADVGIIGYPNVGKSSLLAAISAAKPKIADYPFTTVAPVLGAVNAGKRWFVVAEIPGLIEGAHLGRGLGHEFLRHALRTRVIIHLLDGTSASPMNDMMKVNMELQMYSSELAKKSQLVAVNKVDLPEVRARLTELKEAFECCGIQVMFVSAATGEGVAELTARTAQLLDMVGEKEEVGVQVPEKVFRPRPRRSRLNIKKEGDAFVVAVPELERLVAGADITSYEVRSQLRREIAKRGVGKALEEAGAKPGDKVRCGNMEWEL